MSLSFATAGSKAYIGQQLAFTGTDLVASDFNGQSWTEIGGATNFGEAGDAAELITSNLIGVSRTRKLKGTDNAGAMTITCDLDLSDPGQIALVAAQKVRATYAFKIVFNDAPSGGTPSMRYFVALVMSAAEGLNEANNVMTLTTTLEIDSNVVRVAASISGSAPNNSVLPAITGTAEIGQTLTASTGTWSGTPTPGYSYQWFADGESIPGATASTYVIQAGDEGKVVSVMVVATSVNGVAYAMSDPTATVTSGD